MILSKINQAHWSKIERHRAILNILAERKTVTLKDLEEVFHCARITIQRDLVELEQKGLLTRVRGGAALKNFDFSTYNHENRLLLHTDKKKKIAQQAVSLLHENLFICMDASSTVYFMSEQLFPHNVRVVTTGIDTFLNLQKNQNIQVILTGGMLHPNNRTLVGTVSVGVIRQFHFDLAFLSAESVIEGQGVFNSDEFTADISKAMIAQSKRKILLFDTSKIHNTKGVKLCDFGVIDLVVTDDVECQHLKRIFKEKIFFGMPPQFP
jgi:DeoR/GlpR family transcriptional regulator of sugar metabolism